MRRFVLYCLSLPAVLVLSVCQEKSAISPDMIEQAETPRVIEDLPPLSPTVYEFALGGTQLFFLEGRDAIKDRFHPNLQGVSDGKWTFLEGLASETADLTAIEYYGHGFGEQDGFHFVVVQLKVPFANGYNLVKMVMPSDEVCCRLAGIDVNTYVDASRNTQNGQFTNPETLRLRD